MLYIRWAEILLITTMLVGILAMKGHAKMPIDSMKARCIDDKKRFVCYPTSKGIVYEGKVHSSNKIVKAYFESNLGLTLLIDRSRK